MDIGQVSHKLRANDSCPRLERKGDIVTDAARNCHLVVMMIDATSLPIADNQEHFFGMQAMIGIPRNLIHFILHQYYSKII